MLGIPIRYNLRNLRSRPAMAALTVSGVALTVCIALFIMALLEGLERAFVRSGRPSRVLVIRKGSQSELASSIGRGVLQELGSLTGVARSATGEPLAVGETVAVIVLPRRDGTGEVNVTVRGTMPAGIVMRSGVELREGRWFLPGRREVAVSASIRERFANAGLGERLRFGKGEWTVVGVFESGGTAHDSEIWADVNQMSTEFDLTEYSSVLVESIDHHTADTIRRRVDGDQRFNALTARLESQYYAEQTQSGTPVKVVGTLVAVIMAIGSCFAVMNTMFTAVAYRTKEIATLRILGFTRPSILASFAIESVILSLIGGAVGIALMLPFDGVKTATQNAATFSEVVFDLTMSQTVAFRGMGFALVIGIIGGFIPALRAARRPIVLGLRE